MRYWIHNTEKYEIYIQKYREMKKAKSKSLFREIIQKLPRKGRNNTLRTE